MEKIKYILLGFFILFLSYSCSEDFLERLPYGELSPETYYQVADDAEFATNACYRYLRNVNTYWASGRRFFGDYFADNYAAHSVHPEYLLGTYTTLDGNLVRGSWQRAYSTFARCNTALEGIEGMTDDMIDTDLKNRYMAEIRFIRAYFYFRLVRLYGDVPLLITPVDISDESTVNPSRTPVDQIFQQAIIPDLEFAIANLPEAYESPDEASRATSGAANAYLSLVYLHLQDWAKAETYGQAVINSNKYALLDEYNHIINERFEYHSESVFEIYYSAYYIWGDNNWNSKYFGPKLGGICRGAVYGSHSHPSGDLRDAFSLSDGSKITDDPLGIYNPTNYWENRDPRFDFTFYTPLDTVVDINGNIVGFDLAFLYNTIEGVDFQKHTIWEGTSDYVVGLNFIQMRYPEVLLNVAEAQIMQGKYAEAATNINIVRTRARNYALADPARYNQAGLPDNQIIPDVTISDQADGLEKLRYERRVEFAAEDKRGYALRRWGIEEQTWAAVQGFAWNDKLKLLPIPQLEMDVNPNLTQNPGW